MAVSQSTASVIALMAVIAITLVGTTLAVEAPEPSPESAGGSITPSFAVGCTFSIVALVFGSALKI